MNTQIYALRDAAIDQFMQPMFFQSNGQAIRTLTDEVNRAANDNPIYRHPEDYELYRIGSYSADTGQITPVAPEMVARCKELVVKQGE